MSTAVMIERIAELSPRLRPESLVCFILLTMGGSLALLLHSVANLMAGQSDAAVTLLLHDICKPVNRNISLLAAVFSIVGSIVASGIASSGSGHRNDIFQILLAPDWLPHFPIDLAASNSECADGVCRFGLADFLSPRLGSRLDPCNRAAGGIR